MYVAASDFNTWSDYYFWQTDQGCQGKARDGKCLLSVWHMTAPNSLEPGPRLELFRTPVASVVTAAKQI